MSAEITHYRVFVSGRVQGVGYRHEARGIARFYGLSGIVRNLSDGRVYIEAEGKKEVLDKFISWCRKGPLHGHVDSVITEKGEMKGYNGFNVIL